MTNREAFNEFARGVTLTIGVMGIFVLLVAMLSKPDGKPREKFEVVDHYGTCAVVRYTDDSQRWHYFLDCREVR